MISSEFSRGIWGPGRPSTECLRCAGFHPGMGDAAVSTAEVRSQPTTLMLEEEMGDTKVEVMWWWSVLERTIAQNPVMEPQGCCGGHPGGPLSGGDTGLSLK